MAEYNDISRSDSDVGGDFTNSIMNAIDLLEGEMVQALRDLLAIKSVVGEAEGDQPFGKGVGAAFEHMLNMANADGFDIENTDNYGGHIEFGGLILDETGEVAGTSDEVLGILGHLDVVPEGAGWSCDPFEGKLEDGKIFGRGAIDDKGPVIACYYAMKALKSIGYVPEKKVRLILGLDEETEWKGMEYYLSRVKAPDIGFSPDAEFPAIHGEKGILVFELAKKIEKSTAKGLALRSISGGAAANMVADHARAVVRGDSYTALKSKLAEYREETGYRLRAKGIGKSLEITAEGISAHGSTPEKGLNAISILMEFLGRVGFANESVEEFLRFYNEHIGFELNGCSLGCGLSDELSGALVLNVGKARCDDKAMIVSINVRYPVTLTKEQVYEAMLPVIDENDIGLIKTTCKPPLFIPEDSHIVKTLMDVYRKHTGDAESKPLIIGGGTYARAAKNLVAFGPGFPGEEEPIHQKDEFISVEKLMKITKIYAEAIYLLSKPEDETA
ncbi:MAG: dipeptidase PepV [Clostridiales Family XIII bacterium]|jgi:succinyl-diaminopimelate desuccinylase|nr:dipeptidase PepV [Clostridiales Family XIII bacterium]